MLGFSHGGDDRRGQLRPARAALGPDFAHDRVLGAGLFGALADELELGLRCRS